MRRLRAAAAAAVLAVGPVATACGDPLGLTASEPVAAVSFFLFPFSSAPPSYATAITTPLVRGAVVDAGGNFDVALDLDAEGRIVVLPVRTIVTPLVGANSIGLQKVSGTFEALERAPTGGYVRDSIFTVVPGEVIVIDAQRNRSGDFCSFALSPSIFSKLVIDSVDPETQAISLRLTVNPNCGFRSFAEGIPRD